MAQKLVLVGGNLADDNELIFGTFIKLATPDDSNSFIGIITAASEDPYNSSLFYTDLFTKHGAKQVEWIPIDLKHIQNNSNPQVLASIAQMTGIFVGGGDQSRLIPCFFQDPVTSQRVDSPAMALIRKRFLSGELALAGTSAGTTIMQGSGMITGGESYQAIKYGAHEYSDPEHEDDLSFDALGGFAMFNFGMLDTHFSERGRQGRLIRLATWNSTTAHRYAFGVDENTALVINGTHASVIGQSGVFMFDTKNAVLAHTDIRNVNVSYLTNGDTLDLSTTPYKVHYASWKSDLAGREAHDRPMSISGDIFSSPNQSGGRKHPREFAKVTCDLCNSRGDATHAYTYESDPTNRVDFKKTTATVAFEGTDPVSGKQYISFANMHVEINKYE